MEAVIVVLLIALLAMAGLAVWLLVQRRPSQEEDEPRLDQQLSALKGDLTQTLAASQQTVLAQVNAVDSKLNQRLDAVQGNVNQALTSTQDTIGKIGKQLGELGQSAERIMQVGKDVSSLKDVLQPPKLRGGFGELLLEQLVKQVLPPDSYSTQYRFRDGAIVDLVIRTPDGLVPVDSKFPIESFRRLLEAEDEDERTRQRRAFFRDVRTRVEEVVKYIRPADDTLDFALMYVPAENIYYEAIATSSDESPMTFALERGVHLCSPNTFHAFLQVVLRGFQEVRAQENAQDIVARLGQLRLDFGKFRQEFDRLGTHLGHARSKHEDIEKLVNRFSDRLELEVPVQPPLPEPAAMPSQPTLPQPAIVNGSDEPS